MINNLFVFSILCEISLSISKGINACKSISSIEISCFSKITDAFSTIRKVEPYETTVISIPFLINSTFPIFS